MGFLIVIVTFILMECVTWLSHKYLMHGFLWILHEDHHQPKPKAVFEKNDTFFIIFAIPSMALFAAGTFINGFGFCVFIGFGILLYGIAYFLVHDIFIHQRFKLFKKTNNFYLLALRKAHKVHHKHLGKEDGECFGMLWVPLSYYKSRADKNK
ncbi:MAG: beta-carotene hydroxylase [Bacteroidota bacterium]